MGDRAAKEALFDAFAAVAKALGSGRRAEIVDLLAQGPRSVEEIATEIEQSVANTSHHLHALARGGVVRSAKDGTKVIYRLAGPAVLGLWRSLREVAAEHVGEVDRLARAYLGDLDGLEPVPREELARRLKRGDVVVLDVRPAPEFDAGHIAGARSVPIAELGRRLKEIPKSRHVVAYCRGRYCVFADEAVRALRRKGYKALRLEEGFPEWRDAGLPVAMGEPAG
jgi:rhodanese-related sulfurtransferase/DNA-binding HxlR family transcriptional regulator